MINRFLAVAAAFPLLALATPALQFPLSADRNSPSALSGGVSSEVFAELDGLSKLVELIDTSGHVEGFPGLEIVERWDGVESRGYVAINRKEERAIVAFDGDYEYMDAFIDEAVPLGAEAAVEGGMVHAAVKRGWDDIEGIVNRALGEAAVSPRFSMLSVIGRGVGGSIAALAALDFAGRGLKPKLTTFGQPKLGNAKFMEYFDQIIPAEDYRRVTHLADPLPLLEYKQLQFIHTKEEYFIIKPFPPYTPSDIHICAAPAPTSPSDPASDPICSAHLHTSAFDLDFTRRSYLTDSPSTQQTSDTSYSVSVDVIEIGNSLLSPIISLLGQFTTLPSKLADDLGEESTSWDLPSSPLAEDDSPTTANLKKRSADPSPGLSRALEYFYAPKHIIAAELAAVDEAAAAQRQAAPSEHPPTDDAVVSVDGEELVSQASSVILLNGRPLEVDGKSPLYPRRVRPKGRKGRGKSEDEDGPWLGLTLESTTPASTFSEAVVEDSRVDTLEKSREEAVVNVKKGENFRIFNGRPCV